MASLIYLDTHAVVWLYAGEVDRFPEAAREAVNRSTVTVSPMVLVELQYLIEIGRLTQPVDRIVEVLGRDLGLTVCDLPFPQIARIARDQSWIRDPFDRLIVAQAAANRSPLLTKDRTIQEHYPLALWDEGVTRSLGEL